ncbi:MAG TPA: hypothetical protein VK772_14120 [Puia sp.]|nr:hypothetical protein [Puia sp.]
MTLIKTTRKLIFLSTLALAIIGCTFTKTYLKNPVFNKSSDSIQMDLNKFISYQEISVLGKEILTNNKSNSELDINITNGQNIPTDQNEMIALGKQIAIVIKKSLQNENEYQTYRVLFVTKTENSGITKSYSKGKIFKSEEL